MNETKRRLPEICGLNVLLCLLVIFRINMILDEFAPLRVSVSYAIRLASVYIITIGCAWLFKKARTGARILYRKVRDRSKAPAA